MRCKNCGWPNKPSETVCVKCGSPLEAEANIPEQGGANSYEPHLSMPSQDRDGLKMTVMESDVFQSEPALYGPPPVKTTSTVNESACPKCGYPLRADAVKCPNCNTPVNGNSDSNSLNANTNGYQRRPTRMADSNQSSAQNPTRIVSGGGKVRGTINPYMMNIPQDPGFVLTPLQRMNERKAVEPVELDLEDGEVVLTRDNTEPGNPSITSKAQAVVSHSDGRWYIENRSEQNTTFVMARNKIELHNGDIILLGNRMFEFKEQ